MPSSRSEDESEDTRRTLARLSREAGADAPPEHPSADDEDWAEVWGRRIGRVLGPLLLIGLGLLWAFSGPGSSS